jgi:hypothetical protein
VLSKPRPERPIAKEKTKVDRVCPAVNSQHHGWLIAHSITVTRVRLRLHRRGVCKYCSVHTKFAPLGEKQSCNSSKVNASRRFTSRRVCGKSRPAVFQNPAQSEGRHHPAALLRPAQLQSSFASFPLFLFLLEAPWNYSSFASVENASSVTQVEFASAGVIWTLILPLICGTELLEGAL